MLVSPLQCKHGKSEDVYHALIAPMKALAETGPYPAHLNPQSMAVARSDDGQLIQ